MLLTIMKICWFVVAISLPIQMFNQDMLGSFGAVAALFVIAYLIDTW